MSLSELQNLEFAKSFVMAVRGGSITEFLISCGLRSKLFDFRDARHSGDGVEIRNGLSVDSGEITQFNKIHAPLA